MANSTFLTGRKAKLRLFLDGKERILLAEKWNFKRVGTKFADEVNGEKRSRLGFQTDHYEGSVDCYDEDGTMLDAIIEDQANDDAGTQPLDKQCLAQFFPIGKATKNFALQDACLDDWDYQNAGNKDRTKFTLPFRFTTFKRLPAI
jgi:hypothetical protein